MNPKNKALKNKISKSDKKYEHKATRKLGKITDGGGRPYSHKEIVNSLKSETDHMKSMKIWRQHAGLEE